MNTALLDEARRLSVDDRMELVAAIWDTVAEDANTTALPVSEAHRLELDRRLEDRQNNPGAESPWSGVDYPEIDDDELTSTANELFLAYDDREKQD